MKRLVLLGASGKLLTHLVAAGLDQEFEVRALVADPARIRRAHERLTLIKESGGSSDALEAALAGCNFVICSGGSRRPDLAPRVGQLLGALGRRPPERVILISRVGVADSSLQGQRASRILPALLPRLMPRVYADLAQAEGLLRVSKLNYVIARATRLTDGPATGKVSAVGSRDAPPHRISRADLAAFVVGALEAPGWARREVTIGAR